MNFEFCLLSMHLVDFHFQFILDSYHSSLLLYIFNYEILKEISFAGITLLICSSSLTYKKEQLFSLFTNSSLFDLLTLCYFSSSFYCSSSFTVLLLTIVSYRTFLFSHHLVGMTIFTDIQRRQTSLSLSLSIPCFHFHDLFHFSIEQVGKVLLFERFLFLYTNCQLLIVYFLIKLLLLLIRRWSKQ